MLHSQIHANNIVMLLGGDTLHEVIYMQEPIRAKPLQKKG